MCVEGYAERSEAGKFFEKKCGLAKYVILDIKFFFKTSLFNYFSVSLALRNRHLPLLEFAVKSINICNIKVR